MVTTYKQGLPIVAVAFLAAAFGSCTYNEDDLRGVHQDNLQDASVADLASAQSEAGVNSPVDAEGIDAGPVVDAAGDEFVLNIDAGADAPSSTESDAVLNTGIQDGGSVDDQSVDVSPTDSSDLSINSHDSGVDVSAIDVQVREAGGTDGG